MKRMWKAACLAGAAALLLCGCTSIRGVVRRQEAASEETGIGEGSGERAAQKGNSGGSAEENGSGDYLMMREPDGEGEYLKLTASDGDYYIRRPADRTKDSYLVCEGAFRFESPEGWIWGSCDLDTRLDCYWKGADVPCLLWGIEDNNLGQNAFSEDWEGVCASIRETAETVFEGDLEEFTAEKYALEDGQDVYAFWCIFREEGGSPWTVSAAYRFGEKNMLEFIGIMEGIGGSGLENQALYTAATYEEYEGERYREYEGAGRYKGMKIWEYKKLHNPFVLAYEQANGEVWRQGIQLAPEEDYVVEWQEEVLPEAIKEALGIEGREIMASDLLGIEYLDVVERDMEDYCVINETTVYTDWSALKDGNALVRDIAHLKGLTTLCMEIGNVSDLSPIGGLDQLEVLWIDAGRTVEDIGFLEELDALQVLKLRKAAQQMHIDSLDDELWERTCRELEYTTFSREYDGEKGLAFDQLDLSAYEDLF